MNKSQVGKAPFGPVELEPGEHSVEIESERYLPFRGIVTIPGLDLEENYSVQLVPRWAEVTIESEPPGARILAGDEEIGVTPATIELLEKSLMNNATVQGKRLMQGLLELQKTYECMGDVRGLGLMVGVELVQDRENKKPAREWRNEIIKNAFEKGLLLLGCGENSVRFCPALTVTTDEIDTCLSILNEVVKKVAG